MAVVMDRRATARWDSLGSPGALRVPEVAQITVLNCDDASRPIR